MRKYIIIFCVCVSFISCVVFGISYGSKMQYEHKMANIKESRDTSLDIYNLNKELAESYLEVYKIVDEESYQMVKNDMYHHFSTELQNEIFPTVNYEGIDMHRMEVTLISCIGTNNPSNQENVFKLVYNLKAVNYDQDITNFITVKNGIITKVEKIF